MLALKGIIQGNAVIIEDGDIRMHDGKDVIVTILDFPYRKQPKKIDFDKYVTPTERGKYADSYMEEMRNHDRI